jgi:hypothetical protein
MVSKTQDRFLWYFGLYDDRAQAARVADRAALVTLGAHTALNLPEEISADERRALSAIQDVAAYAEECRRTAPCAQPPKECEYIGVSRSLQKYMATVKIRGRKYYLGTFDDSEHAAAAWDEAAVLADIYVPKLRGGARKLNFPADCKVRSLNMPDPTWAHGDAPVSNCISCMSADVTML